MSILDEIKKLTHPYEDEDDDPRRRPPTGSRINFGELQFGQDYEIT